MHSTGSQDGPLRFRGKQTALELPDIHQNVCGKRWQARYDKVATVSLF